MNNSPEIWQVKIDERYYEAQFDELTQWISEGALLPEDMVTRGGLRWLEAGKVPALAEHFLLFEQNKEIEPPENIKEIYTNFQIDEFQSTSDYSRPVPRVSANAVSSKKVLTAAPAPVTQSVVKNEADNEVCYFHPEKSSYYYCGICVSCFCKECPNSYGTVKLCPLCGGLCEIYEGLIDIQLTHGAINKPYKRAEIEIDENEQVEPGLAVKDLITAFKYPFKFPFSLMTGFLLFAILGAGIGVLLIGEPIMYVVGLVSLILAIMLQFGEFSKTLENLLQNNLRSSYMPRLNKYSFIEEFIHPFFMGGAVYIASFGLFVAVGVAVLVLVNFDFLNQQNITETEMRKKNEEIDSILAQKSNGETRDIQISTGVVNQTNIDEIVDQGMINQRVSIFGNNYLGDNESLTKLIRSFMRLSVYYQMPLFFLFILGILYFPVACSIAGSTRSVLKILNPVLGFKTLKKLGFDYIKITCLFLSMFLIFVGVVTGMFLGFSTINLPMIGIFSSIIIGALLVSYFWVVFSEFLGIAVSNKLIFKRWLNLG